MTRAGGKREREALRQQLLERHADLGTIAEELGREFRYRPREAWRHAHGWTQREATDRYNTHDPTGLAPMRDSRLSEYEKWPESGRRPSFIVLMVLARTYQCSVVDLLDEHDERKFPPAEWKLLTSRTMLESNSVSPSIISKVLMDAADESAQFAHRVGQTNVGPTDLAQLDADMFRIARRYLTQPLPTVVVEILRLRDSVARLLEGRQYPMQARHLYALACRAYGLLAAGCTDLGQHHDAETHARTAELCATLAERSELRAWVLSLRSGIALWDGRGDDAVMHALTGLTLVGDGIEKVRLHSLHARAEARLGNIQGTTDAISAAHEARENVSDDAVHVGMFAFPRANEVRCAGTAFLWVGKPKEAARSFSEALDLYAHDTVNDSYAHIAVTRADLALARLADGDIEAAHDALAPVFALSSRHRFDGIVRRVRILRQALAEPVLANQDGVGALIEALSTFTDHTAADEYKDLGAAELPSA